MTLAYAIAAWACCALVVFTGAMMSGGILLEAPSSLKRSTDRIGCVVGLLMLAAGVVGCFGVVV